MNKNDRINMEQVIAIIREKGQTSCPKCGKGIVKPVGEKETAHWFVCSVCRMKIVEE